MNLWGGILKLFGWKVDITAPRRDKCVICIAPHTSNWDFIIGLLAYKSLGRKANFLMKDFWFFFPLGFLLKSLGGIPVPRKSRASKLTDTIIKKFKNNDYLNLAVTPEGTRSRQEKWKTGFMYIAYGAKVPVQLGIIDYKNKRVVIEKEYHPVGNIKTDIDAIKQYYADAAPLARYSEKFSV